MNWQALNSHAMNKRVTGWLLALYPRAWRDRYGAEVTSLTDELIRAGETTPLPAGLNLVAGAAVERARVLAASRTALTLSSAAVIVALVGGAFTLTGSARPGPVPRGLAGAGCLVAPALRVSVSPAGPGWQLPPTARPQLGNPRRPGLRLATAPAAFRARPRALIVRLIRGGRIRGLAPSARITSPVLTFAVQPGLAPALERKLVASAVRRLVLSARPASVLMTRSGLDRPPEAKVARTAEQRSMRPAAPAWAGPIARSCQQVTAVPDPVMGRTQKLRVVPPVSAATRATR